MAKKKPTSRADAVRQAVDQAFATQIPRERIGELLDELGNTAGRLRGAVDDLRPASAEEVKVLRAELAALSSRVARLEAEKPKPRTSATEQAASAASAAQRAKAKPKPAAKPKPKTAAKPKPKSTAKPKPGAGS